MQFRALSAFGMEQPTLTDAYGDQWEQGPMETNGAATNGSHSLPFFPGLDRDEATRTVQVGKGPNPAPFMRSMLAWEESKAFSA